MIHVNKGSVNVSVDVYAVDARSGLGKVGLTFADVVASYHRSRAVRQAVAVVSVGVAGDHVDGGFVEVDAVGTPGVYRFDVPDAAFVDGADFVTVCLQAEGVIMAPLRVQLHEVVASGLMSEVHLCKAALVNRRVHTMSTGVDQIRDDDGETTLVTMTPVDGGDDVIEVVPT